MLPVILLMMMGPVGTVSSAEPFTLHGTQVPVAGVPSWPVSEGDEIQAGKAPAMITFRGGSRVYVNAGSRVKLQVDGKQPVLRLLKGDVAYKVNRGSPVSLAALGYDPLPGSSEEGLLSVAADKALWSPVGRAADASSFLQYQIVNPFYLSFVQAWRNYTPPFGQSPGTPPTGTVVAPVYVEVPILPAASICKPRT